MTNPVSDTPEQMAMGAASRAVQNVLAQANNRRTLLGRRRPAGVAYVATFTAIETYRETLAHEQARRAGGICAECGSDPRLLVSIG
jgi:hypothetical protein